MTETGTGIMTEAGTGNGKNMGEKTKEETGSRTRGGQEQQEETGRDLETEARVRTETEQETGRDKKKETSKERGHGAGTEYSKRTIMKDQVAARTASEKAGLHGRRRRTMVRGRGGPRAGSESSPTPKMCFTSTQVTEGEGTPGNSGTLDKGRVPAVLLMVIETQVPL